MKIGVRQRLIILIFSGLVVTMGLIGVYRYSAEKQAILAIARAQGEQTGTIMAGFAAPLLITSDYGSLHYLAQNFMGIPEAQDVSIVDSAGREVVHAGRAERAENRIVLGPFAVRANETQLGEIRLSVYPTDLTARLNASMRQKLFELAFVFLILAAIVYVSVSLTIIRPITDLERVLKYAIDSKDFTQRVQARTNDEIGTLASGVNYLIERLEQFVIEMRDVAARINGVSPRIASAIGEIQRDSEVEAGTMEEVVAQAGKVSSSVQSVAESSESLSASAEQTSSAILEMNASNQEVARHTNDLKNSIEEVSTSVMEMIASIREVADHIETVSAAAEKTAASANQIEATVREVERAAKESSRLSLQVAAEARDIGVTSIRETTDAMSRIKQSVSGYSEAVTRLGKRSEEIGKILGVIVEVTERTNLLALNASILAAQAGEHGKGFAVVAEEIKELADRTAGSAQDIGKLIASVQKETKQAVAALTESLGAVDEGVSRSDAAGSALQKILETSGRSAETANMIEHAMTEQARGIKQVSEAVANVKQMMNQIAAATQAQTKGTEMILNASEGMRDISRQVNNAMIEQERGGRQIAEAAENVTAGAGKIAGSMREQGLASARIADSMQHVRELPFRNVKRMEALAAEVKVLEEEAKLLNRELVTITVSESSADQASAS